MAGVVVNSTDLRYIRRVLERQWHVATIPKILRISSLKTEYMMAIGHSVTLRDCYLKQSV